MMKYFQNLNAKIVFLWIVSVLVAAVSLVYVCVFAFVDSPASLSRFLTAYGAVKEKFYRPVSDEELFNGATKGMFEALGDVHSSVLLGREYQNFMESASREYGGIGIVMGENSDKEVEVLAVFDKGSAATAGVQVGDRILSVGGHSVSELGLDKTAEFVRGPVGTSVELTLRRGEEEISLSVNRSDIIVPTVSGKMITDHIGYIHVYSFSKHTAEEFEKELSALKSAGMDKMVIDLRMNPGGLVDSVADVADKILTKGRVVSYHLKDGHEEVVSVKGVEHPLPMAVLVDKNSASASEILAGAVQDRQEGIVVGETTYGKGTVQEVIQLDDTSGVKVSVAEYKTAAGRSIDGVGIKPDVETKQTGTPFDEDTDSVLHQAVDILKGE